MIGSARSRRAPSLRRLRGRRRRCKALTDDVVRAAASRRHLRRSARPGRPVAAAWPDPRDSAHRQSRCEQGEVLSVTTAAKTVTPSFDSRGKVTARRSATPYTCSSTPRQPCDAIDVVELQRERSDRSLSREDVDVVPARAIGSGFSRQPLRKAKSAALAPRAVPRMTIARRLDDQSRASRAGRVEIADDLVQRAESRDSRMGHGEPGPRRGDEFDPEKFPGRIVVGERLRRRNPACQ